jgi:hypothetical protein
LKLFPKILAAKDFSEIVCRVVNAVKMKRGVFFAIGGHVVKCGLSKIIIELMEKGIVNAVIMNGAVSIHDFEIAMIGQTSEYVSNALGEGTFGFASETGKMWNAAVNNGIDNGLGRSLGKYINENNFPYRDYSIVYSAFCLDIPVLVSVAIGDDIVHMHPEASGEAIGGASYRDFLTLASILPNLADGGIYFNIGSAVILPEVFLKAFSITQNLGYDMSGLSTVNMDMISQYRPLTNVVERPAARGGKGYNLIGHHEIMLPLLAAAILQELEEAQF